MRARTRRSRTFQLPRWPRGDYIFARGCVEFFAASPSALLITPSGVLTLTLYASRRGNLNGRSRTQVATLRPARDHQRTRVDAHQRARHSWLRDLRAPRWQRRQFIPTQFARRDLQGRIQLQSYLETNYAAWGYFHQVKTLRAGVHFCTAILRYGRFPPVPFAPAPPRRHPGNAALPPSCSRPLPPASPDTTHCRLPRSHANNP